MLHAWMSESDDTIGRIGMFGWGGGMLCLRSWDAGDPGKYLDLRW